MPFIATGRYRIERGNELDQFGDDSDVATQRQRDVLGSVLEQSRQVFDPSSGRAVAVVRVAGRFPAHTSVLAGDRVIDQGDESKRYVVTEAHAPSNPAGLGDVVCTLTRDTAA